jgi:hypothetical protein
VIVGKERTDQITHNAQYNFWSNRRTFDNFQMLADFQISFPFLSFYFSFIRYFSFFFFFYFSYISLIFLLHFSYISLTFLLYFSYISLIFLLHFSYISLTFLFYFSFFLFLFLLIKNYIKIAKPIKDSYKKFNISDVYYNSQSDNAVRSC